MNKIRVVKLARFLVVSSSDGNGQPSAKGAKCKSLGHRPRNPGFPLFSAESAEWSRRSVTAHLNAAPSAF